MNPARRNGSAKLTAELPASCSGPHAVADRGAGGRAGAQGGLAPAQVRGEDAQPVAAGRELDVVRPRAAQGGAALFALGRRGGGEAVAAPALAGVDVDRAAGLGVDEPEVAGVDEVLLARVDDLDRHHAVAGAQGLPRTLPVALVAEAAHDHDEPALAADRRGAAERPAERGRAGAVALGIAAELGQQGEQPEP